MATRYSDINRGAELKKAQEALENYRKNKTTKKLTGGTVSRKVARTTVTVKPFDGDYTKPLIVTATQNSSEKLSSLIAGRIDSTASALATGTRIQNFRPARIHYFSPDGSNAIYVQSKATSLYYIKYPGQSYSMPFGAQSANEEEKIGSAVVKQAVLAYENLKEYRRAWITSEKYPV